MSTMSRRSLLGVAALLPVAAIGFRGAIAGNQTGDTSENPAASPDASPSASPFASPSASPAASPMASPAAGGQEIHVQAMDIEFDVKEIRIPADTDVTIHVENVGVMEHDFVIDELDVRSEMLAAGQSDSVVVNAPAGEYEYYCSVPGHREAGMVGTLIAE